MKKMLTIGLTSAFALTAGASLAAEPLNVVVTTPVLADMATRVGGVNVTVTSLLQPGADPHTYEPTAQDAVALSKADVIVVNGLGYEGFIDRLISASGSSAKVIDASKGAMKLYYPEGEAHDHEGHDHAEHDHAEHDHAEHGEGHDEGRIPDPHVFQSMKGGFVYMHNILYGFCEVSAEFCPFFEERIHAEMETLGYVERELQHIAANLPQDKRIFLVPHNAFAYFANYYQVEFVSPTVGASEPSAADLAKLIADLKEKGVAAAFPIAGEDSRLIERLAAELSLPLGAPLYAETLSGPDGPANDYPQMLRHNMYSIRAAVTP